MTFRSSGIRTGGFTALALAGACPRHSPGHQTAGPTNSAQRRVGAPVLPAPAWSRAQVRPGQRDGSDGGHLRREQNDRGPSPGMSTPRFRQGEEAGASEERKDGNRRIACRQVVLDVGPQDDAIPDVVARVICIGDSSFRCFSL
jgi:hypothetical protein